VIMRGRQFFSPARIVAGNGGARDGLLQGVAPGLRPEQPVEKRSIALQSQSKFFRACVLSAGPLLLEAIALSREALCKPLHHLRD